MAKRNKKATAKKTTTNKKKATASKKVVKKTSPRTGGKVKLLSAEVFCLAGKFDYPSTAELAEFLKAQGAKTC